MKQFIITISALLVIAACGDQVFNAPVNTPGGFVVPTTRPPAIPAASPEPVTYNGCSVHQELGAAFITCGDGSSAVVQNGRDGLSSGDSIRTVQFCPGYTTVYPSVFPEFGLRINGVLYAVYFDHRNSWLAQLAPGYYASTSTSAPCNFTVNNDGSISQ